MPFSEKIIPNIVNEARSHSSELPWIEFKQNNWDPQLIGEYISALSNTAALFNQLHGLMIWGIDDTTHELVDTAFSPGKEKVGNQGLDLWISTQLDPQVQFYFHAVNMEGKKVVLLEVGAAYASPVKFKGIDYIRIDSHKKKLKDFPDTERELWASFSKKSFETMSAIEHIGGDFVLRLLDYPSYFELLSQNLPSSKEKILSALEDDAMIVKSESGDYNITNMGAILFAKKLSAFPALERKAVRVIKYAGNNRMSSASNEKIIDTGYASGFENLIGFINGLVPVNEVLGAALRREIPMYPELAVRELVANAIIHQNFFAQGTSPMIEIFEDRMEITKEALNK